MLRAVSLSNGDFAVKSLTVKSKMMHISIEVSYKAPHHRSRCSMRGGVTTQVYLAYATHFPKSYAASRQGRAMLARLQLRYRQINDADDTLMADQGISISVDFNSQDN